MAEGLFRCKTMNPYPSLRKEKPQVDPYRWKPLFWLFLSGLVGVPLVFIESLLLREVLAGHGQDRVQACLFGTLTLFWLWSLGTGVLKWWRRPVGEEAIMQAAAQLAQIPAGTPLVFHPKAQARPNKAIYAALPLTCLTLSLIGLLTSKWLMFWMLLGLAGFFTCLFWYVFTEAKKVLEVALSFDPTRKIVVFENFGFVTSFWPEKPRPREEIPFEQVLDCTFYPGNHGQPGSLRINTTRGPTTISGQMENFDAINSLLQSIVTLNLTNPEQRQLFLQLVPKVKIPWTGWLIMGAVFGGLGTLVWAMLTKL